MYIAGETPTFPLNLIKRRLLPLRMVGTRGFAEGGIEKGEYEHGRLLSKPRYETTRRTPAKRGWWH